jgi:lactate dehydrogenase-like 2-hydroxyacid dehydrogenase
MEVRYHNRKPVAGCTLKYASSLIELAQWSDFLVVTSFGGESTKALVSREVLEALGPKGYLINVSRGSVVDQAALLECLIEGKIAGAGLDVFENEPAVPSGLLALDNVVLTPHVASNTYETRTAMMQRVVDNLDSFFEGRGVLSPAL